MRSSPDGASATCGLCHPEAAEKADGWHGARVEVAAVARAMLAAMDPIPASFSRDVAAFRTALGGEAGPQPHRVALAWPAAAPPVAAHAPTCLIFSPHPDDEALVGGLALRLRWTHGWRVVNVAVTLGSRQDRRSARWREAVAACAHLGFELVSPLGKPGLALERVTPEAARREPTHWAEAVSRVASLIQHWKPQVVQAPHALDGHAAHIGTHHLVRDALRACANRIRPQVVWSEYWNSQQRPGLMVELSDAEVARLMAATALHVGEVERHPYHRLLPAWLMDSARRGAERVGAPGSRPLPIVFAALYGWQRWDGQRFRRPSPTVVRADGDLAACLGDPQTLAAT